MSKIVPVIMAGGSGSRLWPLSRGQYPKQFLKLTSSKHTMLQETLTRLKDLDCDQPIVICNEEHRFLVAEQLREINIKAKIVLEPIGRNTAPAIALAAITEKLNNNDGILLILAADHVIKDIDSFTASVKEATILAEKNKLVTFGIVPTSPEVGYGYIKKGSKLLSGYQVEKFIEKPDIETAKKYLSTNEYLWNSGMFMFKASRYLDELNKFAQDIYCSCEKSLEELKTDLDFIRINDDEFLNCRSESIDYAVMEKTEDSVVVSLNAGWSDVGSWSALWDVNEKDNNGNVLKGDVYSHDSSHCFVQSEGRLIATLGLKDIIVIETKDAVLVAEKHRVQDIKIIVESLKKLNRTEHHSHREVYRPWGKYDSIDYSDRYQVKRITVKPGEKLSVQMHHHRSEHWIVVSGTAKIHKGNETFLLTENQSTYIPVGEVHALENPGKLPLELIEVQSGSYLGEDDIVRFEDLYGRS